MRRSVAPLIKFLIVQTVLSALIYERDVFACRVNINNYILPYSRLLKSLGRCHNYLLLLHTKSSLTYTNAVCLDLADKDMRKTLTYLFTVSYQYIMKPEHQWSSKRLPNIWA